jgi:hypothetical protein
MKVIRSVSNTVQQNLYNTFVSMLDRAYRYVPFYIIGIVSENFTFGFEQSATNQNGDYADVASRLISVMCKEKARSFHCSKRECKLLS